MSRLTIFTFSSLICLGTTMAFGQCFTETNDSVDFCQAKNSTSDTPSLQKETWISLIQKKATGKSPEQLIQDPEFMRTAMAWDIIEGAGGNKLSQFVAENPKYAPFIAKFLNDSEWMLSYLSAGLIAKDSVVGLRVLGDIWLEDGKSKNFRTYIPLASGIASSWGAGNYAKRLQDGEKIKIANKRTNPIWRYKFFKSSHIAGKLHKNFINLKPWEIRFVAGGIWDDASLEFLSKRVKIRPTDFETGCWLATYSGLSEFGDTIQGPLYYSSNPDSMGEAERTVRFGGVCGALSHVGSTAAAANGIPSYPVGQPGHCAYGYRIHRGEWLGGFGGPDGGPHNSIFPGEAPTSTRLMEKAFADDEKVATAYKYATIARSLNAIGNTAGAKKAWEAALAQTPHNFNLQREFQDWAIEKNMMTTAEWKAYADKILNIYVGHGFAIPKVLEKIEPLFLKSASADEKLAWFSKIESSIAATKSSWATKLIPIAEAQFAKLGNDPVAQEKFLSDLMRVHLQSGDGANFGQTLEWGIKAFVEKGKGDLFAKSFTNAATGGNTGAIDKKKLKEAYSKAILSAEAARSIPAFRAISEVAKEFQDGHKFNGKLDVPAGKLVSDKGMLRLSTTSSWDKPCDHINVIGMGDGAFHTSEEDKPHAIVELPKTVTLSGILIVKNNGNEDRSKKMTVYRSTDGATWFEIAKTENAPKQWKIEIPDAAQARWIKVEANPDKKGLFHLRNILVFEK